VTGYSLVLRFASGRRCGQETDVYARAKVSLEELTDASGIEKVELAGAAKAAADGQLARARQALEAIAGSNPRDPDIAALRGEVELHARDAKAAVTAWTAVSGLEKSPRASFGLARANQLSGDSAAAQKFAQETLRLNPRHVGARLLLAEDAWTVKRDEGAATKLLEGILARPGDAGPEERIGASTLFGEIHLNRGRVSQAEQSFNDAIKTAEGMKSGAKGARALSGLGEALFRAGRYSQAQADFKAAAQADPDYVPAQVGLAKSSLELERVDEAKEMLVKLRKSYPADMQVAYWYGRVNESLGDRKEAEVAFRDAITSGKDDPDVIHAFIALARVQSQQGMSEAANTTLADAQKRLPASPALFKALGRVAMTQGRYADAQAAFDQALALDAGDLEAKFLVGTALVREHQFEKALEIFDAVGKVDRDLPGLALERGLLFQESGRTEEALREYEGALAKAPNDPDLMLRVGCGKADAGSGDEAEKLLRKVLGQRPNSAETHYCLGRAIMAKADFGEALKEFSRAVQIDPNHAEYHLYVGWAANEMGQLAKAQVALKKALDLDQGLADAYWQRGVLRLRETRARDAIEDLTKALQLRPSRYEAHADLALAYYDLGKEDLALAEWQKAIAADSNRAEWRYHYGKLLNLHLQSAAAAEQLKKAIDLVVAKGQTPVWLSEAHRLCALSLGSSPAAVPHWQAFLKMGAADSPFRNEAKAALKRLGAPWEE
jgi:tetratricopeptide (TPR) repeat protein